MATFLASRPSTAIFELRSAGSQATAARQLCRSLICGIPGSARTSARLMTACRPWCRRERRGRGRRAGRRSVSHRGVGPEVYPPAFSVAGYRRRRTGAGRRERAVGLLEPGKAAGALDDSAEPAASPCRRRQHLPVLQRLQLVGSTSPCTRDAPGYCWRAGASQTILVAASRLSPSRRPPHSSTPGRNRLKKKPALPVYSGDVDLASDGGPRSWWARAGPCSRPACSSTCDHVAGEARPAVSIFKATRSYRPSPRPVPVACNREGGPAEFRCS